MRLPTWSTWIAAVIAILAFSIELFCYLPLPSQVIFDDSPISSPPPAPVAPNPNCCIATVFDSNSIQQTVVLGHSLHRAGSVLPRTFAILTSPTTANLSAVEKYFQIINASSTTVLYPELLFWSELNCAPVVAVTHTGLFNRPADRLCSLQPFGAVSRIGEVVYFEPNLMILDPTNKIKEIKEMESFSKFINQEITDWRPIPSELSVADVDHDYLNFWLLYGTPTFIHFGEDTFQKAVRGEKNSTGSFALFDIIRPAVAAAVKDHKELFKTNSTASKT
jgi:hypothetical protein